MKREEGEINPRENARRPQQTKKGRSKRGDTPRALGGRQRRANVASPEKKEKETEKGGEEGGSREKVGESLEKELPKNKALHSGSRKGSRKRLKTLPEQHPCEKKDTERERAAGTEKGRVKKDAGHIRAGKVQQVLRGGGKVLGKKKKTPRGTPEKGEKAGARRGKSEVLNQRDKKRAKKKNIALKERKIPKIGRMKREPQQGEKGEIGSSPSNF